jgi:surfactin synthase thioesterase subunit
MEELNHWLLRYGSPAGTRTALFCFPYAGGSPGIFQPWVNCLPPGIHLAALQWPGRGKQLGVQPFRRVRPLARKLAEVLRPALREPFAFFGHSLGALIAFEVALELRAMQAPTPIHIFASGRRAPRSASRYPPMHIIGEKQFIRELKDLNGCPQSVLTNPELLALFIPILRADCEMDETYVYEPAPPLDCSITAFGGSRDIRVSRKELEAWSEHTARRFKMYIVPGDHFFLHGGKDRVLSVISEQLSNTLAPQRQKAEGINGQRIW